MKGKKMKRFRESKVIYFIIANGIWSIFTKY